MKVLHHALALFACAATAWIAVIVWEILHPTTIPEYSDFANQYSGSEFLYIWLGAFSVLSFFWFLWDLKTKHD